VVKRHSVSGARAAVVTGHEELVIPKRSHYFDLILSHDTE
jgi:hypothetical protein